MTKIVAFLFFLLCFPLSQAQNNLNPWLYSGKMYLNNYPNASGTPFFGDGQFKIGKILLKHDLYGPLFLQYDLTDQQVVLKYNNLIGATVQISIPDTWLQEFWLEEKHFVNKPLLKERKIFQLIGDEEMGCAYYWYRTVKLSSSKLSPGYYFTKPQRKTWIIIQGEVHPYRNNRQLIQALPLDYRSLVKDYLSRNQLKVKNIPDEKLENMLRYIKTLHP